LADLQAYSWPGNVRELRNVVERAVYRHEDPERPIDVIVFNPFHSPWAPSSAVSSFLEPASQVGESESGTAESEVAPAAVQATAGPTATNDFRGAVSAYERALLEDALRRNRFNQRATASSLGLSYDQLRHALKRHKLLDAAA